MNIVNLKSKLTANVTGEFCYKFASKPYTIIGVFDVFKKKVKMLNFADLKLLHGTLQHCGKCFHFDLCGRPCQLP